jgi:hypothetical protein
MDEVSTEGCLTVLDRAGLQGPVMDSLLAAIQTALTRRAGDMRIGALLFSSGGLLGLTEEGKTLITKFGRTGEP